jgi:hypothetical protein
MGGQQSSLIRNDSDVQDCQPCFFVKAPFRSNDPIGSPLPDTPIAARHRKQAVKNELKNTVYSSRYVGLEKEVVPNGSADSLNGRHQAEVHEGKVSREEIFVNDV